MGGLKKIGLVFLGLALVAVGAAFLIPDEYRVERSIVVDAPAAVVFDHINDLRKNELWSPWKAGDPSLRMSFTPRAEGVGARYSWTSDNSGAGSLTITSSVPYERVETRLKFEGQGTAYGYFLLTPTDEGVEVTEGFYGYAGMSPVARYMNLMMDRFIGPSFEQGLGGLKAVSEAAVASEAAVRGN